MTVITSRVTNNKTGEKQLTLQLLHSSRYEQKLTVLNHKGFCIGEITGYGYKDSQGTDLYAYKATLFPSNETTELIVKIYQFCFFDPREIHHQPSMLSHLLESFESAWRSRNANKSTVCSYDLIKCILSPEDAETLGEKWAVFNGYELLGQVSILKDDDAKLFHIRAFFTIGTWSFNELLIIDCQDKGEALESAVKFLEQLIGKRVEKTPKAFHFESEKNGVTNAIELVRSQAIRSLKYAPSYLSSLIVEAKAMLEAIRIQYDKEKYISLKFLDTLGGVSKQVLSFVTFYTHPYVNTVININIHEEFNSFLEEFLVIFTKSEVPEINNDPIIKGNTTQILEILKKDLDIYYPNK